ncbi:carboxylesterase 1 [Selaginella moellendorffii]|uniref:carboxylesterase 1 n=1 Tax=Selaginella moellendorffii TaxID=88036 RepID=UPI000D1C3E9A|nr:carboxylesterase 1 [Selaginella moellendorffii]|eukprot:XP_024523096.1 carboxylesterase 1 [Selaginella moellendorffii]
MMGDSTGPPASAQSWEIPEVAADSSFADGVASRDVKLGGGDGRVWVRLYLPAAALQINSKRKLPIVVHVHGGGFVRFSAATSSYHDFCKKVATDATALVVSLNHRLAPASCLPAAYQDLVSALHWLRAQALLSTSDGDGGDAASATVDGNGDSHDHHHQITSLRDGGDHHLPQRDPWLASYADFSSLIFMGGSSGGNIVHNALLMVLESSKSKRALLPPLSFAAQILLQPFFGGAHRTASELRLSDGPILTLAMSDQLWSLALPDGASRDHPFCDPLAAAQPLPCNLPPALVIVGGRDLLHDRQVAYADFLRESGVEVKLVEYPDATHGFVTPDGTVSYVFMPEVLQFIRSSAIAPRASPALT